MKKVLCSLGAGAHEELLRITGTTFRAFARTHGYDLVLRTETLDRQRPVPWSKILLIAELFKEYDLVLWIDADATIVDLDRDIASECRGDEWLYLVQHHTPEGLVPNSGVLLLRSCPEARAFLDEVWDQVQYLNHKWWENAAIIHVLGYEFDPVRPGPSTGHVRGLRLIDRSWNSVLIDPSPSPIIKHYAGVPDEDRLRMLSKDLDLFRSRYGERATTE